MGLLIHLKEAYLLRGQPVKNPPVKLSVKIKFIYWRRYKKMFRKSILLKLVLSTQNRKPFATDVRPF